MKKIKDFEQICNNKLNTFNEKQKCEVFSLSQE